MFPKEGVMHLPMVLEHVFFGLVLGWAYRAWHRP
jgi:hypothetical protein